METPAVHTSRIHPLIAGAAVAVTAVSLLGMAAITGIISPSHAVISNGLSASTAAMKTDNATTAVTAIDPAGRRYQTADGQVFEVDSQRARVVAGTDIDSVPATPSREVRVPAALTHRRAMHHHTQPIVRPQKQQYVENTYSDARPAYQQQVYQQPAYEQPAYQSQAQPAPAHPVLNYVNDMHPVGTGVGAVIGGLLGNQVGGGNGKKIATLAGALLGGYTGNEVAHNRNPLDR